MGEKRENYRPSVTCACLCVHNCVWVRVGACVSVDVNSNREITNMPSQSSGIATPHSL
jgi:hypothetical protein